MDEKFLEKIKKAHFIGTGVSAVARIVSSLVSR